MQGGCTDADVPSLHSSCHSLSIASLLGSSTQYYLSLQTTLGTMKFLNQFSRRLQGSCTLLQNQASQRLAFSSKASALSLTSKKRRGQKITMVTAYDYPSGVHVARAGIDIVLVGDSAAMVEMGFETTQPVTLDQMLHHCQNVKRGLQQANSEKTPMLIGDMPFGSYEYEDTDVALRNAYRFVKEAGVDAVKIEVSGFVSLNS
jgi:hypothetical protein